MIVVIFSYLFVFCLVCFLKTSFTDPGIIPRAKDWDKKKDPEIGKKRGKGHKKEEKEWRGRGKWERGPLCILPNLLLQSLSFK
jgi:hypothetical protein